MFCLHMLADVVSGVGSVLGPVLFIVFIDDMCRPNCIPGTTVLKLFADDAKLFTTVSGDGTCGDLQISRPV